MPAPPPDEVDEILAAWTRERPDLDVTPLQVLSRVSRIARALDGVRRNAFSRHGLEPWEFDVLAALRRSGDPYTLSPGQLISATGVTSGTMTNRLDGLTARGLVERQRGTRDRRGIDVHLTPAGASAVDSALADLVTAEAGLLADIPGTDQRNLATLLRALAARLP